MSSAIHARDMASNYVTSDRSTNNARTNGNGNTNAIGNGHRTSNSSSIGTAFATNGASWNTNNSIWNNSLTSGFGSVTKDNPRSRGASTIEGKTSSASLVPTSEPDNTWGNRSGHPWPSSDSSPAVSNAILHDDSMLSLRGRNSQQNTATDSLPASVRSNSPYWSVGRQAPIGQGLGLSPHKSYLDPTSGTFNVGAFGDGKVAQRHTAEDSHRHSINSIGNGFDYEHLSRQGSNHGSIHPPSRGESIGSQRLDGFSTPGDISTSSIDGNMAHSQYSHPTAPFQSQRHAQFSNSGHSASASSVSNSRNYDNFARTTDQADVLNGMDRLRLGEDNIPNGIKPQTSQNQFQYGIGQNGDLQLNRQVLQHSSQSWNLGDSGYGAGSRCFTPDGYPESTTTNPLRPMFGDRGSISPAGSDYRKSFSNSFYSTGGTPPGTADNARAPSRGSQGSRSSYNQHPQLLHKKLTMIQQQEQQGFVNPPSSQTILRQAQYGGQYSPHPYDYNSHQGTRLNSMPQFFNPNQLVSPAGHMGPGQISQFQMHQIQAAPRGPSRDRDQQNGETSRSALLDEFRSNTKNSAKKYELKDILGHIVEFSGDQHGSRLIQSKLETANSDEKEKVFAEVKPNCMQLMQDVFGNYVIQKFFEHGTQNQKNIIFDKMKNHILTLSTNMYGCRVVQKALEHVLEHQQAAMVKELETDVLKCVKDQNGNHVIQKAIERVPLEHIQFIINSFIGQVHSLATHAYGCRVIQRMLEHCDQGAQEAILKELHSCSYSLVEDQYGNYVVQHVIEHGKPEDKSQIVDFVIKNAVRFSRHKYASNVVEKSITFGSAEERRKIIENVSTDNSKGESNLSVLMKDQYGNYVVQKLLTQIRGPDLFTLIASLKTQLAILKKFNMGKQIQAIEKLVYNAELKSVGSSTPPLYEGVSAATTPPLLTEYAQSPRSSSHPSTNTSTVDGPARGSMSPTLDNAQVMKAEVKGLTIAEADVAA